MCGCEGCRCVEWRCVGVWSGVVWISSVWRGVGVCVEGCRGVCGGV